MQINPGPKGLISWTEKEKDEGRRLAVTLSPVEIYLSLTVARCIRYEKALKEINNGDNEVSALTANIALYQGN